MQQAIKTLRELFKMDQAAALYHRGMTLREAAAATGVSHTGLYSYLKRHNLPVRSSRSLKTELPPSEIKRIVHLHHHEKWSLREIGKEIGVDKGTIKRIIHAQGRMTFTRKQMRLIFVDRGDDAFRDKVISMFLKGHTRGEIRKAMHIGYRRIRRIIERWEKEQAQVRKGLKPTAADTGT